MLTIQVQHIIMFMKQVQHINRIQQHNIMTSILLHLLLSVIAWMTLL